jgi:site-specific DNA-methyltransferase (adenine-specific)
METRKRSWLTRRDKVELFERIRREYEFGVGTIAAVSWKLGVHRRMVREALRSAERRQRQLQTLQELMNTTAKADVLDFLDGLPDDSFVAQITRPPYNLGKRYGECPSADAMLHTYYHGWLMMVISEMASTLKPGGVVCLNMGSRDRHELCAGGVWWFPWQMAGTTSLSVLSTSVTKQT